VRREYTSLVRNSERVESLFSFAHDFEIRIAAHKDADHGLGFDHDKFLQQ
jgi:hypothetical protein